MLEGRALLGPKPTLHQSAPARSVRARGRHNRRQRPHRFRMTSARLSSGLNAGCSSTTSSPTTATGSVRTTPTPTPTPAAHSDTDSDSNAAANADSNPHLLKHQNPDSDTNSDANADADAGGHLLPHHPDADSTPTLRLHLPSTAPRLHNADADAYTSPTPPRRRLLLRRPRLRRHTVSPRHDSVWRRFRALP